MKKENFLTWFQNKSFTISKLIYHQYITYVICMTHLNKNKKKAIYTPIRSPTTFTIHTSPETMSFLRPKPPQSVILMLTYASLLFLISPANALICSSQKLSNNLYTNCTDLPTLNSSLHWTHIANTSSISIAFVAPPSKPDGWIAWAINPTGTGMPGSQALLAFKVFITKFF